MCKTKNLPKIKVSYCKPELRDYKILISNKQDLKT